MEQSENEEELLQCIMCTNQVPEEFLRRHIKFHHMIQKEEAIKKVYQMHLPGALVSANTQTYVTWIDTLENLEESIVNIENNTEQTNYGTNKEHESEVQVIKDNSSMFEDEDPDSLPSSPCKSSPSKTHQIANQMNSLISKGTLTVTKVKEDEDEPVIIAEKKTEKFIPKSSYPTKQKDTESLQPNQIDPTECVFKVPKQVEKSQPKADLCTRYRCPYCDFVDFKRYVVNDHVIIQHSKEVQDKNKCTPMYGEAKKQEMQVGISTDSTTRRHLKHYKKIESIEDCREELEETKEVKTNSMEEHNWEKSDATLPYGWLIRDMVQENGNKERNFLSPCKQTFTSRDKISEFLMDQGQKMIKTNGFKVAEVQKSKCDAMCEGKCKLFVVPKSFYHPRDKNKKRKKTQLKFIADNLIPKSNKARDKMAKRVPKFKFVKGLKYKKSGNKGTRPWIIFIEETPPDFEENVNLDTEVDQTEETKIDKIDNQEKSDTELMELDQENIATEKFTDKEVVKSSEHKDANEFDIEKDEMEKIEKFINLTNKDNLEKDKNTPEIKRNYAKKEVESDKTERDKIKENKMIAICTLNEDILLGKNLSPSITISSVTELSRSVHHKGRGKLDLEGFSSTNENTETYNTFSDIEVVKNTFEDASPYKRGRDEASPSRIQTPLSKKMKASDPKVIVLKENAHGLSDLMYNRHSPVKEMPKTAVGSFHDNNREESFAYGTLKRPQKNDSDTENEVNKKRNIEKLKRLQKKEIEVNKNEGTYVQCCDLECLKWRLVKEFEDPSMVPDYWICSMNSDPQNNTCGVGGHSFMSDAEAVDVKFTCGSMVWAKMHGYPWWPGMVDYCPDSEEYYWIEESISMTEPAWYHVVFFEGKGNQVSRAWVKSELIMKITLPIDPPKNNIKSRETKVRLVNAVQMATNAKMMSREERLEKYSFAALFNGKWGIYSDIESDTEERSGRNGKQFKSGIDGSNKSGMNPVNKSPSKTVIVLQKKQVEHKVEDKRSSISMIQPKSGQKLRQIMPKPGIGSPNRKGNQTTQHFTHKKFMARPGIEPTNEDEEESDRIKKFKNRSPKKLEIEKHKRSESFLFSVDHCYSKTASGSTSPKKSTILENLKYVNKALEDAHRKNFVPDKSITFENPNLIKHHPKPPLPSDVLIALSVRNLDPSNHFGASFNSIIAFLSLHFPYFNRNVEECKEMVRKAYDINTREETGKENFRIKNTLIAQLSVRINSYVDRNRGLVKKSMLISDLLETFMDRFLNGNGSNQAANFKPQFGCKMISYLTLISVSPPSSLEQLMLFITFLFPSLQNDKTCFRKQDFEAALQGDEHIEVYFLATTGQKMFILKEGSYPSVLQIVRQYFGNKNNMVKLRKSITRQDIVNIILPNLSA